MPFAKGVAAIKRPTFEQPRLWNRQLSDGVVCRYRKGTCRQHGIPYLLFVVYRVKVATQQLPHHYRDRFGIETSY